MRRILGVVLGEGLQAGDFGFDLQGGRESALFGYGAGWLGDPLRFALGPMLPIQAGPQFHRRSKDGSLFHAAIADPEPDGWARRVMMRDHSRRSATIAP
jgi:serine/threonine-protein kinase HipA